MSGGIELSITVKNLSFSYGNHKVLDDLSFQAMSGEMICLLGPNGVGKSTLFKIILRLLHQNQGKVEISGQDTEGLSVRKMAELAAYIPQSHEITFSYKVFDMVLMGTTVKTGYLSQPDQKQKRIAEEKLDQMGILELKNRNFDQISGGERQLVLIARALAQDTKVLIMDEPTANLDYGNQIKVLTQIKGLAGLGYTILQATHQPEQAFLFADKVIALKDGRLYAYGTPGKVITEQFIKELYDVDVKMQSICNDRLRVCVPVTAMRQDTEIKDNNIG